MMLKILDDLDKKIALMLSIYHVPGRPSRRTYQLGWLEGYEAALNEARCEYYRQESDNRQLDFLAEIGEGA